MKKNFDYFVLLAEMRTGSNYVESNLNEFPNLSCIGEAFNPHFIGYPNKPEILGFTLQQREFDPARLLEIVKSQEVLTGFRFFHDHDPRVVEEFLGDKRCAKIILSRNPIESYVSWKIAVATGQWKLTNVTQRKATKTNFDPEEYARFNAKLQSFRQHVLSRLQKTGQTAFFIEYEDIRDIDVLNGLARYLGESHQLKSLNKNFKKQNPSALIDKVTNPDVLIESLAKEGLFGVTRVPNFEPARTAGVNSYVAHSTEPLLYLPIPSGPNGQVKSWLEKLGQGEIISDFDQKRLRQWKRKMKCHRSFTVVRHPAARAHTTFCTRILNPGPKCYGPIRDTLKRVHKIDLPDDPRDPSYDRVAHRGAFASFLEFLKANLSGQTAIRVDGTWASQTALVQGMAQFAVPDLVFREATLNTDLEYLSFRVGLDTAQVPAGPQDSPFSLSDIYDDEIEKAVRAAYQRDYMTFGFRPWAVEAEAN